jgi:protein-S-isoprenylcysteine O-methyltransferase Ste14
MNWLTGRRLPRWTGVVVPIVAFPAVHAVLPWALSLPGARHGWAGGRPGISNLVGLIAVAAGFYIFFLCSREHFIAAPEGWLLEPTPHHPTPSYLLTEGPYRYSCNPIYLAELVVWLGWMAFYGSIVIASVFAVMALLLGPVIVPREERGLEVRFGNLYREYRRTTPRWLGKPRR